MIGSWLKSATRKAKVAKYGMLDSIWFKCPELCSVVAATLSKDAVKERIKYPLEHSKCGWMESVKYNLCSKPSIFDKCQCVTILARTRQVSV